MYYLMGTVIKEKKRQATSPQTSSDISKDNKRKDGMRNRNGLSETETQRTEDEMEILDDKKRPSNWKRSDRIPPEHKIAYAKLQQLEMETALKRLNLRMDNIEAQIHAPKAPPSTSSKMSPRGSMKRFQERIDHYKRSLIVPRHNPNAVLHPKQRSPEEKSLEGQGKMGSLTIPDQEPASLHSPLSPHNEYFNWFDEDRSGDENDEIGAEDYPTWDTRVVQNEEALVKQAEKLVASIRKTREINIRLEAALRSMETETVCGFMEPSSDETKQVRKTCDAIPL